MKKKQAIKKLLVPEEKLRAAMELFPGKTREEVREILFRKVVHRMKLGGCLSLLFFFVGVFVGKTSGVEQGVQREEPGGIRG